jgi:hypothetical protein
LNTNDVFPAYIAKLSTEFTAESLLIITAILKKGGEKKERKCFEECEK